jgi:hypothetical protein
MAPNFGNHIPLPIFLFVDESEEHYIVLVLKHCKAHSISSQHHRGHSQIELLQQPVKEVRASLQR